MYHKIIDLLAIESMWFSVSSIPLLERIRYALLKYVALIFKRKVILFLSNNFYYDNRFTPLLLATYPAEINNLLQTIKSTKPLRALDIGANVGQWARTLLYMRPNSTVVSFEPNTDILPLLQRNGKGYSGWKVLPYGISKNSSKKMLNYNTQASDGGSFVNVVGNTKAIQAQLIALTPSKTKKLNIPRHYSIVKIDVEGMEEDVLLGLRHIRYDVLSVEIDTGRGFGISVERVLEIINAIQRRKMVFVGMIKAHQGSPEANAIFRRQ